MQIDDSLALVVDTPSDVRLRTLSHDELGPTDVLIRTSHSGISTGTDKWVMQGRFRWENLRFPLSPGYQRSGTVEAVGSSVTKFAIGQRVAATTTIGLRAASSQWGSHTALAASPQDEVFDATGVDPVAASLFVSVQVGVNAASRILAEPGSRVAVIGGGIIGSSASLAARARGFEVLVLDHHDEHLAVLSALGLDILNNDREGSAALDDWQPVAVIDTAQSDEAFDSYISVLPPRTGQIVFSGHSPDGTRWWGDMTRMQQRELTAHFVSGWTPGRLSDALALLASGAVPAERLVGTIADDAESVAGLTETIVSGKLGPIAAAIDWSQLQR